MGIGIETNLNLVCSLFQISYEKITGQYKGMSVSQIMEQEVAEGNTRAQKFSEEILSDPKKLIEFVQLNNPSNKFAILSNMNEGDLLDLIPLLGTDDMQMGLNFFNKDALVLMVALLPPEEAANLSLQIFSPEHLMMLMPQEAIDKVLQKKEVQEMDTLAKDCVSNLPPEILAQMIEAVTGQLPAGVEGVDLSGQAQFNTEKLLGEINGFDKEQFQDSLLAIPPVHKKMFMISMTQEEPQIWTMFESPYFAQIINEKKDKNDIVAASGVLDEKHLMQMTARLPKELMSVVLTQIDTKEFAKTLQRDFADVIGQLTLS